MGYSLAALGLRPRFLGASSAAGSGSAFAFRVGFFTGFSAGASAALGLRPGFFASPRLTRGQEGMHSHYLFVHNIG